MKWLIGLLLFYSTVCLAQYADLEATYYKNYDGDTITVNIKDTQPIFGEQITVRLANIDAPEMKAHCEEEKRLAIRAQTYVEMLLRFSKDIILHNPERGKYFRVVADVLYNGNHSLSNELIDAGLAVEYHGGTKSHNWCDID